MVICSTCRKHLLVLSHSWLDTGFVTRLTWRVPLVEQELLTLPENLSSPPVFSGVRVSLVLCVCFVDRCLSFCTFGHCVVCSSSIYRFWVILSCFFFRYGYHLSLNSYFICNDKNIINQLFNDLRNFNGSGKVRYIVTFANIVMLSIDCINKASLMLNCVIISRLKVKHHQWMDNKTCHPRFLVGFVLFDL